MSVIPPWQEIDQRYDNVEILSTIVLDWLEGAKKREKAIAVVKETEDLRCAERASRLRASVYWQKPKKV